MGSSISRRGRTLALCFFAMVAIWLLAVAGAKAALPTGCTQSGSLVTCPYAQGQKVSFTVPTGVTSLSVHAAGGTGGGLMGSFVGPPTVPLNGGSGAVLSANVSVTPGSVLSIQVGANGTPAGSGAGGGGAGACGGGGGASSVSSSSGPLAVAAGGGGDGCYVEAASGFSFIAGGVGGNWGEVGSSPGLGNAGGGQHASPAAGGAGGTGGTDGPGAMAGNPGGTGSAGLGGAGGTGTYGVAGAGGGGGGGLYGGGGGGQGATVVSATMTTSDPGAGGGGGSSLLPAGGSLGTDYTATPKLIIFYTAPSSTTSPTGPTGPSARITTAKAKVIHGKAMLRVTCRGPGTCQGRLTLTRTVRQRRRRHVHGRLRTVVVFKTIVVASGSYTAGVGRSATVTLRIGGGTLTLLERHSLAVLATASVAGGKSARRTVTLALAKGGERFSSGTPRG